MMSVRAVAPNQKSMVIELGQMAVTKDPSIVLTCLGLGSCIGVAAYDPVAKVAGMVHIVLPSSQGRPAKLAGKFADIAIPTLLEEMKKEGALKVRTSIKIAGGAEMTIVHSETSAFHIGEKNAEAVKDMLKKEGIKLTAEEIGGNHGRSLWLDVDTGRVIVSMAGGEGREL